MSTYRTSLSVSEWSVFLPIEQFTHFFYTCVSYSAILQAAYVTFFLSLVRRHIYRQISLIFLSVRFIANDSSTAFIVFRYLIQYSLISFKFLFYFSTLLYFCIVTSFRQIVSSLLCLFLELYCCLYQIMDQRLQFDSRLFRVSSRISL
jgi:type III secretory pathway component EscS